MTATTAAALRTTIEAANLLDVPTVHDALSAVLADDVGFEVVLLGDGMCANFAHGLPDIGVITISEVVDQVRRITSAARVGVIADLGDGGGHPLRIHRAMRMAEQAGAIAVMIEDTDGSDLKHVEPENGSLGIKLLTSALHPADRAAAHIEAAATARTLDTVIIARTDAYPVDGHDAATKRAAQFVEAGADLVLVTHAPDTALGPIHAACGPRLAAVLGTTPTAEQRAALVESGVRIGIFAARVQTAAYLAIEAELRSIRDGTVTAPFDMDAYLRVLGLGLSRFA